MANANFSFLKWKDPIVEETRSRREDLARRFNYDIKAIWGGAEAAAERKWAKADHSPAEAGQTYCAMTRRFSRQPIRYAAVPRRILVVIPQ